MAKPSATSPDSLPASSPADDFVSASASGQESADTIDTQGDLGSAAEIDEPAAELQNKEIVGEEDIMIVTEDVELKSSTTAGKYPLLQTSIVRPTESDGDRRLRS